MGVIPGNRRLYDAGFETWPGKHGVIPVDWPYPEFLSLPIAALCEGKSREDLRSGDESNHLHLPHSL